MLDFLKYNTRQTIRKYPKLRYRLKKAQRYFSKIERGGFYLQNTFELIKNINLDATLKKQVRPQASLIEITNACNLNCLMCNTKLSTRPEGLMKPEVFERIIKQLKATKIHSAGLHTVGETFVYKDLKTLLDIARKHDFWVWISTNAQFPDKIEPLFRQFPETFTNIRISIDGATKETFERIRVNGSFEKVIETMEAIHRINKGERFYRIGATIDSILNLATVKEIPSYFETFEKYVFPENINFGVITGLSPDDGYFKSTFPFKYLVRSAVPCYMPFTNQYFTYDGQATMCCRDYNGEITVGNIMEKSSMEIWNGPEAEAVRQQHLDPETLNIEACKNCFMPYDFVSPVTNNYLHFLKIKLPNLSDDEFAKSVVALWEGMNEALENKDVPQLRSFVTHAFNEAGFGRHLSPKENVLETSPDENPALTK